MEPEVPKKITYH